MPPQCIMSVKKMMWALALLLLSVPAVQAQGVAVAGGPYGAAGGPLPGSAGELHSMTQMVGNVICTDCTVEEVRATQPQLVNLYRFDHESGELVFQIEKFADSEQKARWIDIAGLADQVSVRSPDVMFQELAAEKNRFKQVAISGMLRSNRTFDLTSVNPLG